MNFSRTELEKMPLTYKNGVVHFAGRTISDHTLRELRGNWINGLGKFHDEPLIVTDGAMMIGDQVMMRDCELRKELIKEMSRVEFLGTTYSNPRAILSSEISIIVNGHKWIPTTHIKGEIVNELYKELKNKFEN